MAPRSLRIALTCVAIGSALSVSAVVALDDRVWLLDIATLAWPYILAAAIVQFVVALAVRGLFIVEASMVTLIITGMAMFETPDVAPTSPMANLRVLTANLFMENEADPSLFVDLVRKENPDVLVLQEVTVPWERAIRATGLYAFESNGDLPARDDKKVFSKFPILSETVLKIADGSEYHRTPTRFELDTPSGRLVVYDVHPETPRTSWQWRERNNYLDMVAQSARSDARTSDVIVAGDWNTTPWSPAFQRFFRLSGLTFADPGFLPPVTRFSLKLERFAHVGATIDHVAVSRTTGVAGWKTGSAIGSNHLPVIVDLTRPTPAGQSTDKGNSAQ